MYNLRPQAPKPSERSTFDQLHKWLRDAQESPADDEWAAAGAGTGYGYVGGGLLADGTVDSGYTAVDLNAMYGTGK